MTASRLDARVILQPPYPFNADKNYWYQQLVGGRFTIDIPKEMSFFSIRNSPVGSVFMDQQRRMREENYKWPFSPIEARTYRLRLCLGGWESQDLYHTFLEQQEGLKCPGEITAPIALVMAAFLCIAQSGCPNFFDSSVRFRPETGPYFNLFWEDGRLRLNYDRISGPTSSYLAYASSVP